MMATKEDKHVRDKADFADSDELFESIYRAQLDALRKEKAEKPKDQLTADPLPIRGGKGLIHVGCDNSKGPATGAEDEEPQLWTEKAASEKKSRISSKRGKL